MNIGIEALPDDIEALKALLIAERHTVAIARAAQLEAEALAAIAHAQVADAHAIIEDLKLRIAKARQDKWGQSSERHRQLLDQLEMQLEDVVATATEDELAAEIAVAKASVAGVPVVPFTRKKPTRAPLPADLPRHRVVVTALENCPCCNGADLKKIGETITESREVVPRQWIVVQTVREKFICKACETITQPPAPFHPIPRASAGPNLLAMVLFNKFGLHQPLNRQSETYAAEGMSISVSTLADYVGHGAVLLRGLVDLIEAHILSGERIHHDDTTVPVMAAGKTITGRIWASVRDDRPFGGTDPTAVCYYYTRDRTGAHPQRQLARYAGILQADAYTGYDALYAAGRKPGPILEAACWAHARRPFFKEARLSRTPLAVDIVTRMDAIFAAERVIWGRNAGERFASRQAHIAPLVADLEQFLRQQYGRLSRKGDLAKAINYMLSRWDSFARFVSDGRICMTNNAAERRVRTVATTDSYYTSFSNARKQGLLVLIFDATRAPVTRELRDLLAFKVRCTDLMRRVGHDLLGWKDAFLDQSTDTMWRNSKLVRSFRQSKPLAVLLGGSVAMDLVDGTQRPDTAGSPGFAVPGLHAHAVEGGGDICVGPSGRHGSHDSQGRFRGTLTVFAGHGLTDAQLRVLTTFPMNGQNDLALCLIDVGDDVGDKRAQELLTTAHINLRRSPSGLEVGREPHKIRGWCSEIKLSRFDQARLVLGHPSEGSFPALFKLRGDQPVVRVASCVAAFGKRCLVASLLQIELDIAVPLITAILVRPLSLHRGLDRHWCHGPQHFSTNGRIDPRSAEGHASGQRQRLVDAVAVVIGMARCASLIDDTQSPSASSAREKPSEQRPAASARLDATFLPEGVDGDMRLVFFKLAPLDIAFMVIFQQNIPCSEGFAVAITLTRTAIDDLRAFLAFTIGIDASVERVLEDRNNVSIADWSPIERDGSAAVGRPRKMEMLGRQRNQYPARAAKFAEPGKYDADCLLNAKVRIKPQPIVTVPEIADGNAQAQFATASLGAGSVKHTGPQNAKLEFADAPLHAQQQAIIWSAGVIHAVQIDDPGLDQSAQLQKVVPVPAIAGKPGRIEAKHSTDLAGAQPAYQSFEPRPFHGAAGASTKIIVDHFHIAEPPTTSDVDEFILPSLTLEVGLDLRLGRLTNVDHCFALQHRDRQKFTARHHWSPRLRSRRPPSGASPVERPRNYALSQSVPEARAYRAACSTGRSPSAVSEVVVRLSSRPS